MADTAGDVDVVIGLKAATYTAGMREIKRGLDQLGTSSRSFTKGSQSGFADAGRAAQQFGHSSVTSVQAASGALRELNGDITNNIRAVERFITTIPGVGNALKAIYPLVGGLAVAGMFYEAGKRVSEFIDKLNQIPTAINTGFRELHSSAQLANDALAISNDQLENEIAKLQHKPENGLQSSLDEARQSADKLADSLTNDITKVQALLKTNQIGFIGQLMGKGGTADSTKTVNDVNTQLGTITSSYQDTIDDATSRGASRQNIVDIKTAEMTRLEKVYADAEAKITPILRRLQYDQEDHQRYGTGTDQSANIAIYSGALRMWRDQQQTIGNNFRQDTDRDRLNPLRAQHTNDGAQNTADDKRLKAMEEQLNAEKLNHQMSLKETYDFWASKRSAFTEGSSAYNDVVARQTQAATEAATKAHEVIAKYLADAKKQSEQDQTQLPNLIAHGAESMHRMTQAATATQTQGYLDSNQLAIDNAHNAALEREAQLSDQAGRSITRYAAALQLAQVHAHELDVRMTSLRAVLDIRTRQAQLDPSQANIRAQTQAQEAVNKAQTEGVVQQQRDSDNINGRSSSGLVGFQDALSEFVQSTRDMAKTMQDLTKNALGTLNGEMSKAITGQRTNFGGAFLGVGQSAIHSGLQAAEGGILSAFGVGGKAGSKSNPLYVRMADSITGTATHAASSIASFFHSSGGSGSGVGSSLGGIFSRLIGFLPHFAAGGPMSANMLSVVGENGPELFSPGTSGRIIPNHQLSIGGGGTTHNWSIDARGSTDPAATRAAVQQGVQRAVGISMQAQHQQSIRRPSKS